MASRDKLKRSSSAVDVAQGHPERQVVSLQVWVDGPVLVPAEGGPNDSGLDEKLVAQKSS